MPCREVVPAVGRNGETLRNEEGNTEQDRVLQEIADIEQKLDELRRPCGRHPLSKEQRLQNAEVLEERWYAIPSRCIDPVTKIRIKTKLTMLLDGLRQNDKVFEDVQHNFGRLPGETREWNLEEVLRDPRYAGQED